MKLIKIYTVVFLTSIIIISCDEDTSDSTRTESVKINYDSQGVDNCIFVISTKKNEFYTTDQIKTDLPNDGSYEATISFIVLDEYFDCGFSGSLQMITITSISEIKSL